MSKPLSDRIALVTGASRGIGAAVALQLAQAGAHVIAVARTVGGLEELDDKIKAAGGTATLVPLDMKDSEGIARLALALQERYARLDVLVGNAGILRTPTPLGHIEPKDWDEIFAINVTANWHSFVPSIPCSSCRAAACVHDVGDRHLGPARTSRYAVSKAADIMVRTYAAECAGTCARQSVQSANPHPHDGEHFRRRSGNAADARRGTKNCATVPARLHGDGRLYDFGPGNFGIQARRECRSRVICETPCLHD